MIETIGAGTGSQAPITNSVLGDEEIGKEAFLRLLMVQLQHQDPMDPVKNEDFIAQLAQFSSLEQLTSINQAVSNGTEAESLAGVQQAIESNTAVSLIGKEVGISSETLDYGGEGSINLSYHLDRPAIQVNLRVYTAAGNLIRTLTDSSPQEGNGSLPWNGMDAEGNQLPAGTYHVTADAVDGVGNPASVQAELSGKVTGVQYEAGSPILILEGGVEVPLVGISRIL